MPFDHFLPRFFAESVIRDYAPALSGIYGLSNALEWIYIGETDNIREALLEHLHLLGAVILNHRPTGFVFEVCDRETRHGRQDRLVLEYEPTGNRHQ